MAKLLPVTSAGKTWRMLGASVAKTPWQFAWMMILFIVSALLSVATPVILGQLIDRAAAGQLTGFPWGVLALIALVVVLGALLTRAWTFAGQKLGVRLNRDLGIDMVGASLELDAQTVEDSGSGDLLSRLTDDVDSARQVLAQGLPEFLQICVFMMISVVTIFTVNPYIGMVTVPMLILMVIMLSIVLPMIGRRVLKRTEATSQLTVAVNENIRGARTIRELGIESARADVQQGKVEGLYQISRNLINIRSVYWALDGINAYSPLLLSIVWGAVCVQNGWATWGDAATASILLFNMRIDTDIFTFWLDRLREMTVTMGRVFGVIDLSAQQVARRQKALAGQSGVNDGTGQDGEQQLPETNGRESGSVVEPAVNAQRLVYGYSAERPVIKGISLRVEEGQSLALVGRSGSGKTTLARLLAGSLTADSGSVLVAGQPVGNGLYPTQPGADGRPALLICTQEAHLFIGTLADNMTVAAPHASGEQQLEALRAVGAHWVDELPDGLATELGPGSFELTRDQVQQLALARIVAANPRVVILDESTTQLELADARQSLAAVMDGRAVIIISHDARIASLADRAVLLEDGQLVAEGSPAEIFARA